MSIEQALTGYTVGSSYSTFTEDRIGKIEKGYYADLVILQENLFAIEPERIKDVQVAYTIVNGKIVYKQ